MFSPSLAASLARRDLCLALAILLASATTAFAQDAQRVAPKLPEPNGPAQVIVPAPATRPAGDQLVVPDLKGLVFVDAPDKVQRASTTLGIDTAGAPLVDSVSFRASVAGYLAKPLTLAQLNEICQKVVAYCRSVDRPVVDGLVPQQDVTNGTIQILVLQAHVGQVRAEGNRFFPTSLLVGQVRAHSGDPISEHQLLDDVDWLNRNPFRHTDLVFDRGQQFGQTDVVLSTEDHLPLRVYGGYDNTGPVSTGQGRYYTGLNWGDAFGLDDQLNYQFTTAPDLERFYAHSGSYVIPLPWRHVLTLFGNWASTKVQTAPGVAQSGEDWQVSARYEIPLPRFAGVTSSLVLGGDFKRSNTNAEFGGSSVFSSYADVVQFMLGYNASRPDRLGSTDGALEVYVSPGNIGGQDSNEAYQQARPGADPHYVYAHLSLDRATNLPAKFSLVTRFQGQVASAPLQGSEQLGVGGLDSVRGYTEREGNGDDGILFSNEVRTPPASFFNLKGRKDELTFLAFCDYGMAWTRDSQAGQLSRLNFLGVGPGISYRIGPWFSFDYDYGWRLARGSPTVHEVGRSSVRLIASFTY